MIRSVLALVALSFVLVTAPAPAQTPTAQLATPPANAETWTIFSSAGQHGRVARWTVNGVRWSRQSLLLRGFVTEIDQQLRFTNGAPTSLTVRGVVPEGDAAEMFSVAGGRYTYQSSVDHGDGAMTAGAIYNPYGGTLDATIALADALRAAPDHAVNTLPSGRATMEQLATLDVSHAGATKHLTAYAILGLSLSPRVVWYEGDRFFGFADVLNVLPTGWDSAADTMSQAQDAALAQRSRALVDQLGPRPTHPVVFQDVQLYDSINRRFREHMTVIVNNGRVTGIYGNNTALSLATDAQIIPGAGRTLVPGLWDSHMHYGDDSTGPLLLANGITSARDPGNRQAELQARIRRINAGELLGPRVVPSLIIDGPGPYAAQAGVIVSNEAEALAAVQRAKNEGYFGVKLYGSLPPPLVPIIAREAHRLHLRVHGHVPAGMRPLDAINAGYDEITHINFSMMQAMPDDVVAHSNSLPRFYGPGQYGGDVDPTAQPMRGLLDVMQRRHIAVDPTLVVYEQIYVPDAGEIAASYAPFSGTMPSQLERGFRSGGLSPTPEASRASMRRAFTAMSALVREMHRRNLTIVAGTDGYGIELVRELELYVAAGFTPADALATATIVPSRLYGAPDAGQITVGKPAELFLVQGDPSTNIGDLRHVIVTMRDGRLMDANALRASIGISGMPH